VATLRALGQIGGIDLEISARQIIEQYFERDIEQIAPTLRQMREQILFVGEQEIVTGIELVSFREAEVASQEIGHGAVEKPLPMQSPFAARRDEPVGRQHLQNLIPTRSFAAFRQSLGPEPIEPQLPPQHARQPTGAPLARAAETHLVETEPDDILTGGSFAAILGEERERSRPAGIFVEHLDGPAPSFRL
jgi:hypothetical protein